MGVGCERDRPWAWAADWDRGRRRRGRLGGVNVVAQANEAAGVAMDMDDAGVVATVFEAASVVATDADAASVIMTVAR